MKAANLTETMSLKDIQAVESALKSLRANAAFLVTLTRQERDPLPHPRPAALALVERALAAAKDHAGLMPKRLDLAVFERQARLTQALDRCVSEIEHLNSDLRDTLRVVSSDPLKTTAEIRAYVKAATKRTPALEELAGRLAVPKPKQRGTRTVATPSAPAPAPTAAPAPETPPQQKAA